MAQLDAHLTGDQEVVGSTQPGRQHSFVKNDHEILSVVILPLADPRRAVVSFWWKDVHNTG